jgi:hypothetical protein
MPYAEIHQPKTVECLQGIHRSYMVLLLFNRQKAFVRFCWRCFLHGVSRVTQKTWALKYDLKLSQGSVLINFQMYLSPTEVYM